MSAGRARGGVRRRPRAPRAFVFGLLLALATASCTSGGNPVPATANTSATTSGATTPPSTTAPTSGDESTGGATSGPATTSGPAPSGSPAAPGSVDPASCPVPARPAPPADRPRYTMDLVLQPSKRLVTGDLTAEFTADEPTDRLVFRLWPNGPRQRDEGAALTVGDVTTSDGTKLATELPDPTTLVVHPPEALGAGDSITVSMPFRMTTPGRVLDRIATDGEQMRLGSFFPILAWQPGIGWALDPPTVSLAEASTSTTADFDVTIHAPADATVVASGVNDPDAPEHWTAEAVRDFAIAAGPFEVATVTAHAPDPVLVTMGVQPGVRIPAQDAADRAARDLEAQAALYGAYPWPELHLVITKDVGRAGIEYPTMIFEGAARFALTVSHEVGHQWFYSLVGNDQALEPWLDEALTTWSAANVSDYLDFARSQPARGLEQNHVAYPMTFWDVHQDSYGTGVYWRGAQALDALGPVDAVNCALRRYVARFAYGIATTEGLLHSFTEVFPNARETLQPFGIPAGD